MEKMTINGKVYPAKEIDMNFFCELETDGVYMEDIDKSVFKTARCYARYCMGVNSDLAGVEMSEHMSKAGNAELINEIYAVFREKADESGFFRALTSGSEESDTEKPKKASKKTEEASE